MGNRGFEEVGGGRMSKTDKKRTIRLRTLSEIQEDIRTLTRVPSEFIHAKLDELAEEVGELVNNQWIPVTERLPEERNSIFAKFKGTADWWKPAMFEKTSPYVIATVRYKDGTVLTEQAHTEDGKWKVGTSVFPKEVIAWMPLPEPYREEQGNG